MLTATARSQLERIFTDSVKAVDPALLIHRTIAVDRSTLSIHTPTQKERVSLGARVYLIGAGKGAAQMARALSAVLGEHLTDGVIVVPDNHTAPIDRVAIMKGEHPLPGQGSLNGTRVLVRLLATARPSDLVCVCLTGGASSLLVHPVATIRLDDKTALTQRLLASGATIHEINCVRKHLSLVKGGQLARSVAPVPLISFILSDVIGDDLSTIGSGPTVPDVSTFQDAWTILARYDLLSSLPARVESTLRAGLRGHLPDTPEPGSSVFCNVRNFLVGNNAQALEAGACAAEQLGYSPRILRTPISGDTRQAARQFAQKLRGILRERSVATCFLAGGETTTRVVGVGKGGRNQEFALVVAQELQQEADWVLLSAGTDGIDGPTDAAGAFVGSQTISRAHARGLSPEQYLDSNDSHTFFSRLGDLYRPGSTGTNVMDIKIALLKGPPEAAGTSH